MATPTSDSGRDPNFLKKRRKVTGTRNRAQQVKRSQGYKGGRHTVGGAKPQPKSTKVTVGSGAKNRLRGIIRVASLLKKGSVAGYIASDITKGHGLSKKEWNEGPGTLSYARKRGDVK